MCKQLLDHIDYDLIRQNPKILIGYSDNTTLLTAIHSRTGLVTFMGPSILPQFGEADGLMEYTKQLMEAVLLRNEPVGAIPASEEYVEEFLRWDVEDDRPRKRLKNKYRCKSSKAGGCTGRDIGRQHGMFTITCRDTIFP
jgi:muramoyltetrapeptide carboxypeptidase